MKERDRIAIAFRYLKTRSFESIMVIIGLAFGVAVLAVLLSLISAMNEDLANEDATYLHQVSVRSKIYEYYSDKPVQRIGTISTKEAFLAVEDIAEAKAACPLVRYAYSTSWASLNAAAPAATPRDGLLETAPGLKSFIACCTFNDYFLANKNGVAYGSIFASTDQAEGRKTAVLGARIAKRAFPDTAPGDLVGKRFVLGGAEYSIIGVLAEIRTLDTSAYEPNNRIYIPFTANPNYAIDKSLYNGIDFYVDDLDRLADAAGQLEAFFGSRYDLNAIAVKTQLESIRENQRTLLPVLTVILAFATAIVMLSSLNILNLMLARSLRRGKSVGIAKALGSSKKDAFLLVLTETLLLGLTGGCLGMGLALPLEAAVMGILDSSGYSGAGTSFALDPAVAAIAFIVTIAISAVISLYPAAIASRIVAAETVRGE
jgi:ABC-type lipoprotein release transport system permease subunit